MIEKSVQDSSLNNVPKGQKIHVSLDPEVFEELEYLTSHFTSYGLFKPTRKALLESLIVREYNSTREFEKRVRHS